MSNNFSRPFGAALCLFAAHAPFSVLAQVGQNGSVQGTITANHAPVATASVSIKGPGGFTRQTTSGPDGTFTFLDLPSGDYSLSVTASGFNPLGSSPLSVAVGRATQIALALSIGSTTQSVQVSAGQSTLDTAQTSSVVNIDRDRMEELPVPSRNYLTFVALSPEAAPANPALSQLSLAPADTGFSFGGLRPGSNAVQIDGVEDDDEYTGGSRTELSPEAISDFQIVNHGFAAQSGGAAGGSVDVQTRLGQNQSHGDAFVFVQNGALNGTPPLGVYPRKPDESRMRIGLSGGGALRADKTFYYLAGEQEYARGEDVNDFTPQTASAINQSLRATGPLGAFQVVSGFFPTVEQETELSGRIDHTLSRTQSLMARYAFSNNRSVNDAFHTDELTDSSAHGSAFVADNSLNGTLSSTLGNLILNKLNVELAQRRAVERTTDSTTPGVLIAGTALFGTPYNGNSRRYEKHFELEDHVLAQRGHHLLQAGYAIDHIALRARVVDGFAGFYVFPSLAALSLGNASLFTQTMGQPETNFAELRMDAYAQDHWAPTAKLALDYGLRYEVNRLPSPLPQHPLNVSPRFGLAYTPVPKLVIRSGFGIFYDRFALSTLDHILQLNGKNASYHFIEGPAAAQQYQSGSAAAVPSLLGAPSIWSTQAHLANPYSEVASVSVEQALPLQTTISGEYQYVHGVKLGRATNSNLLPPLLLTQQNAASLGIAQPTAQQLGRQLFSSARANPAYDAINQFATEADSTYNGLTLTLNRQFQDNFELLAGYTVSKTLDDASYDLEQPQNPFDLRAERSLSLEDQRQRFTLSGLWLIGPDLDDPDDAATGAHRSTLTQFLNGFEFAPIVGVTSGFHANPLTGVDTNQEHIFPFAARPFGFGRNTLTTRPTYDVDLRVLKTIPAGPGHLDFVAESFNLLNHENQALLNTVYGSGGTAQPGFDQPIATGSARQVQFSLDFEY